MPNNIKEDLVLFNELSKIFLDDEYQNPVAEYIKPGNIKKTLDIKLQKSGITDLELKKLLIRLLLKSPKSSSKRFFNQLFGGRNSKAVLGDLLSVMLNTSMATYKISGPQVAIEKEVISEVCNIIGYGKNSGGTFPTGGSMSNFMSLVIARDKASLLIKNKGVTGKLIAYSSENAHYSVAKNASFSGIGKDNVRYIKSDKYGKIDILELQKQITRDIDNGLIPFYLNATAGTTVLCAFDDILSLSPICKKYNIWLHLDGAFGGSVIFSEEYKKLVEGIHLTNSFCFNAHKTLGAPLSTSVFVVKDKQHLYDSFNHDATYLYQTHDESYNLGQTSFECGRRNNAIKLWTMWKAIGTKGIAKIIEHEFELANKARQYIKANKNYKLYSFEKSLSVCFNYKDFDPEDLCAKLYKSSTLMVGFGEFHTKKFIRLVTINGENTVEDILNFFKILEKFSEKNSRIINRV